MRHLVNLLKFTFLTVIVATQVNAQTIECKYLMALSYVRMNPQINDTIKKVFPYQGNKKDQFVEFNLSNKLQYLSFNVFEEKMMIEDSSLASELKDLQSFRRKYYFETSVSPFLQKISFGTRSKLYLSLSNPVGNYLIVEFTEFDPAMMVDKKFGKALDILFRFDQAGFIEQVRCIGMAYN